MSLYCKPAKGTKVYCEDRSGEPAELTILRGWVRCKMPKCLKGKELDMCLTLRKGRIILVSSESMCTVWMPWKGWEVVDE